VALRALSEVLRAEEMVHEVAPAAAAEADTAAAEAPPLD
jgi:hypothetical protein